MRVLRLDVADHLVVDLHPAATVLVDVAATAGASLRRSFGAIASGLAPCRPGLIEAHGVLLDATQPNLDLLELAPAGAELTAADLPGAIPPADADRLRRRDDEVRAHAAARRDAAAAVHRSTRHPPTAVDELASRADLLRLAIRLHETTDAEPVRSALDAGRDSGRAGGRDAAAVDVVVDRLAEELAVVGIDVRGHDLPLTELCRIAEDWIEEHARQAAWARGAGIELRGLEARIAATSTSTGEDHDGGAPATVAALRQAADDLAAALDRASAAREQLAATAVRHRRLEDLEGPLLERLDAHRREGFGGSMPLLVHGILGGLADADVGVLLGRLADAAGPVQLVVVDEHPAAAAWAEQAGIRRAAVVAPAAAVDHGTGRWGDPYDARGRRSRKDHLCP